MSQELRSNRRPTAQISMLGRRSFGRWNYQVGLLSEEEKSATRDGRDRDTRIAPSNKTDTAVRRSCHKLLGNFFHSQNLDAGPSMVGHVKQPSRLRCRVEKSATKDGRGRSSFR